MKKQPISKRQALMFAHVEWEDIDGVGKIIGFDENSVYFINKGQEYEEHGYYLDDHLGLFVKPILRTLDQMTDEEACEIAKLADGEWGNTKQEVIGRFDSFILVESTCNETVVKVAINSNFDIGLKNNGLTIETDWQLKTFDYIIQQGFDAFGWIEQGLAIKKEN